MSGDQETMPWVPDEWTQEDTRGYLDVNPLPIDFRWFHRDGSLQAVLPQYRVKSYGKWLWETPYFPGLFELIHSLIVNWTKDGMPWEPGPAELVERLEAIKAERVGQGELFS